MMPANYSMSSSAEFAAGHTPLSNSGRGNDNSLTLGNSLQAESDRLNAMTPRGVLQTTLGGSPSETDAGVEYGQQALGNTDDADMAQTSMQRMMMQRSASIGSSDSVD